MSPSSELPEDPTCRFACWNPQGAGKTCTGKNFRGLASIYGEEFVNGRTGASWNRHKLGNEKEKAEK
jgi:rare lipoprotein A (peptidoglycan hydrolase)